MAKKNTSDLEEKDLSKQYDISVINRFVLESILPKENNFITMRLVKNIKDKLELTDKEREKYKIIILPNGLVNFQDKEIIKETKKIRIDDILVGIIKEELKKLDEQKKISQEIIEIYEMFIQ